MRRSTLFPLLLATACATAPAPRLTLEQAMADGAPRAVEDSRASPPLKEALDRFAERVAASRAAAPRGAAMPEAHVQAWGEALDQADALLATAPERTSALDLARARVVLETALEADIGAFGDVPEALGRRITGTLARLAQRLPVVLERPRRLSLGDLRWPTSPVLVTSAYGDREHPIHGGLNFHSGVDLRAERAQPVYAAAAGTVVFSGWNGGYGKHLELQHDAHLVTRYSHLLSLLKGPGQVVRRGELIGLAGDTGLATGPHLHFEVRRDGVPLDPEATLPPAPGAARVSAWR